MCSSLVAVSSKLQFPDLQFGCSFKETANPGFAVWLQFGCSFKAIFAVSSKLQQNIARNAMFCCSLVETANMALQFA